MDIKTLQKHYQLYRFINTEHHTVLAKPEAKAEPKAGAITMGAPALQDRYLEIYEQCSEILNRSYESCMWYYMVYKPFDKQYNKKYDWYQSKALEWLRRNLPRQEAHIITKETEATKTHYNVIICSKNDLSHLHDTVKSNKFKVHCKQLLNINDRLRCLEYIIKESKSRYYNKYDDINIYSRKCA